jgi:hypothetical protein
MTSLFRIALLCAFAAAMSRPALHAQQRPTPPAAQKSAQEATPTKKSTKAKPAAPTKAPGAVPAGVKPVGPRISQPVMLIVLPGLPSPRATPPSADMTMNHVADLWDVFTKAGCRVRYASIDGGVVPVAHMPGDTALEATKLFLARRQHEALEKTERLSSLDMAQFRAVIFAGGPSAIAEYTENAAPPLAVRAALFTPKNVVACAGYGAAALIFAQRDDSTMLLQRLRVTCPSESEEEENGLSLVLRQRLETTLRRSGAIYFKDHPHQVNVVTDDRVLTAQNLASTRQLATDVLIRLQQLDGVLSN